MAKDGGCATDAVFACYTGPAGTKGVGICQAGTKSCAAGKWGPCIGQITPNFEICDGKDNNCNGKIDEDFPNLNQVCTAGIGECKTSGTNKCIFDGSGTECSAKPSQPTAEVCDGKDNDCDGQTDEDGLGKLLTKVCYSGPSGTAGIGICKTGTSTCAAGLWSACVGEVLPKAELCNTLDDDCDGLTNEDFSNLGQACAVGIGECKAIGFFQCKTDGTGTECSAKPGVPVTEICDNKDNNCNGSIDDSLTNSCYTGPPGTAGVGLCKAGTQICSAGIWGACIGEVKPTAELCDGKDNNCNSQIDENLTQSCYSGPPGTQGVGPCKAGTQTCSAGAWGSCASEVLPATEVCDNIDNNCNSSVDESLSKSCYTGPPGTVGVGLCKAGSHTCSTGIWGACAGQVLPSAEICDNKDNDCDGSTDESVTQSCYTGPPGTVGVGPCKAGSQACIVGVWGNCAGQVVPVPEVCDGTDNNCDGIPDDGLKTITFYKDADGDGYGNPASPTVLDCIAPPGYSANNLDCDDNDSFLFPGANKLATLDSVGRVGLYTSIAIDSGGKFHISYQDDSSGGVKYATNSSGMLAIQFVDCCKSGLGTHTSIAVDSAGKIHIAYKYSYWDMWGGYGELNYATNASGAWVIQKVDTGKEFTGDFASLVIDKNNKVHIAYRNGNSIKYASNASGSWVSNVIESGNLFGTSLALDSAGKAHVSYGDAGSDYLKYANNVSGFWTTSILLTSVRPTTSIALDSGGKIHIAYSSYSNVAYISNKTGSWVNTGLGGGSVSNRSLAIDKNSYEHISHTVSGMFTSLGYFTNRSGSWQKYTVDSAWGAGPGSSIAVEPSGKIHFSYFYDWAEDLKYAVRCN